MSYSRQILFALNKGVQRYEEKKRMKLSLIKEIERDLYGLSQLIDDKSINRGYSVKRILQTKAYISNLNKELENIKKNLI